MQRNTTARVEIAKRSRDRPSLVLVVVTVLGALGAGLAAAYGLRQATEVEPTPAAVQPPPERQSDGGQSSAPSAEVATSARADASVVAEVATAPAPASERDTTPSEARPTVAPVAAPAAPAPQAVRTSAQGRVRHDIIAYIRCDGLRPRTGRFPCPRDLELEREVATILDKLPSCGLLREQSGLAVVRLELTRDGASPPRASAPKEGGLDPESVLRCAGGALSKVQTTLDPDRMIVRFRFELR
ncbi:MAG: hypothetical protein ACHQ53_04390 [Polyangiales bacterium]